MIAVQDHPRPGGEAQRRRRSARPAHAAEARRQGALRKLRDDRVLAEMTKRVFSAGFAWSVIESKWPGFEDGLSRLRAGAACVRAGRVLGQADKDARIVRNGAKIMSVRDNARFVLDVAKEHGSVSASSSRHGRPRTRSGCSSFWPSAAAASAGTAARCCSGFSARTPSSRRRTSSPACATPGSMSRRRRHRNATSRKIQEQFNAWAKETGLPYRHMSLICAMSIGENYEGDRYSQTEEQE